MSVDLNEVALRTLLQQAISSRQAATRTVDQGALGVPFQLEILVRRELEAIERKRVVFAETWWSEDRHERRDWCATSEAYHLAVEHPGVTTAALFDHWRDPATVIACVRCQGYIEQRVEAIKAQVRKTRRRCRARGCGWWTKAAAPHMTVYGGHTGIVR